MKLTKMLTPALFAAMFTFAGCVNSFTDSDVLRTKDLEPGMIQYSKSVEETLKLIQCSKQKTEGKLTYYVFRFRTRRDGFWAFVCDSYEFQTLAYRTIWYDKNGKEVMGEDPSEYKWFTTRVRPDSLFVCTSTSPSEKVTKVKLFIKLASELTPADKNAHTTAKASKPEKVSTTKAMMSAKPQAPAQRPDASKIKTQSLTDKEKTMAPEKTIKDNKKAEEALKAAPKSAETETETGKTK